MASSDKNSEAGTSSDFTHFLVIDFEATCTVGPPRINPQEIIEFPIVIVDLTARDPATGKMVSKLSSKEFHEYVRPVVHPNLTTFCMDLTGIQQEVIDKAKDWKIVWAQAQSWIKDWEKEEMAKGNRKPNWRIVTCGHWDLGTMLPAQMALSGLTTPVEFKRWINIKLAFKDFYGYENQYDMKEMLEELGLPLVGRHHSGIDDARNIAGIMKRMIEDGLQIASLKVFTK